MIGAKLEALVGTPWSEANCAELVDAGLERLGIPRMDVAAAWRVAWERGWRAFAEAVPPGWRKLGDDEDLRAGDVVVMHEGTADAHVALAIDRTRILQSTRYTGAVISTINRYRPRITAVWRHDPTC